MKKNEKGFTLIELLVVIAIIGVLAAIAIPQFAAYKMRANNALAKSDMRNAITGEEAYYVDNDSYLACSDADCVGAAGLPAFKLSMLPDGTQATDVFSFTTADLNGVADQAYSGSAHHVKGDVTWAYDSSTGVISE